jgi:hypothetical protein
VVPPRLPALPPAWTGALARRLLSLAATCPSSPLARLACRRMNSEEIKREAALEAAAAARDAEA